MEVGVTPPTGEGVEVAVLPPNSPTPGVGVARMVAKEDKVGVTLPVSDAEIVKEVVGVGEELNVLRMNKEGEGRFVMVFPPPPPSPLPSKAGEGVRDMDGVGLNVPKVEEEGVLEPSPVKVPPEWGVGVPPMEADTNELALLTPLPVGPPPPAPPLPREGVGRVLGVAPTL